MAALGTRLLEIVIDGTARSAEISSCKISAAETSSDFVSFADAAAGGGRDYTLDLTAVQDLASSTLWDLVWASAGSTVACTYKPYGNVTASPTQPHYTFSVVITEPDGDFLGGDADASTTARFTFDVSWLLTAKPTKVTS